MNVWKWTNQGRYRTLPSVFSEPYTPPPRIERETPARHDLHPFDVPAVVTKTTDEPKEIYAAPVSYFDDAAYPASPEETEQCPPQP